MCGMKLAIQKGFDSEPVYKSEKYLKIEIKSFDGKINTNFHDYSVPKEGSHCVCLSGPLIDSTDRLHLRWVKITICKYF